MNGLDNLRAAVREYSENYRKDGLPPFEISKLYNIERDWANSNPLSDRAGCYAFFDEEFKLSYIGKASKLSSLGARIGSYFIRSGSSNFAKFRHKWKKLP